MSFPKLLLNPKTVVQSLHAYQPPLENRRGKTRLDFNENTQGFPQLLPSDWPADLVSIYPEYDTFLAQLSEHLGLPVEQLLLTNGSDEGLNVLSHTFIEPGVDKALCLQPTFAMIPHALRLAGAELLEIPVTASLELDEAAIEQALVEHQPKVVILASPDNPTGVTVAPANVRAWCTAYPQTLFVLDEAYQAYEGPAASVLALAGTELANLAVTRTFSKAQGLAGLRLGYVVAHPQVVQWASVVRSPYSVNTFAVAAASRLLKVEDQVQAAAQATVQRKQALLAELNARGFETNAGGGNFFLLRLGLHASDFAHFAAQQGLLVRDQSSKPHLAGCVRVTVGTEAENQQFLSVLEQFYQRYALIFDLDDTLIDTSQSFDAVVQWLMRKFSEVPLGLKELQTLRLEGGYNDDWLSVQELLRRRNVDMSYEDIASEGTKQYLAIANQVEKPLFSPQLFNSLRQRYRLFIMTGRYRPEFDETWAEKLNPYFDAVYCMGDLPPVEGQTVPGKPAPDYLQALMQRYGLEGGFYIGNSVDDMRAARGAGLVPIGVTQTQPAEALEAAGAARLLGSVNELPPLLDLLLKQPAEPAMA